MAIRRIFTRTVSINSQHNENRTLANIEESNEKLHSILIKRDQYADSFFLELEERLSLKGIFLEAEMISVEIPLHHAKKLIYILYMTAKLFSQKLVKHKLFLVISLIMTVFYCLFTYVKVKQRRSLSKKQDIFSMDLLFSDDDVYFIMTFFQIVFITENVLKMIAFGLWGSSQCYLKNLWYLFDLVLILISIVYSQIIKKPEIDLILFRSLTHIKFLKIPGFQKMLKGFLASFSLVMETILIVGSVFLVFAIFGVQMFAGLLNNRCLKADTGKYHPDNIVCGNQPCEMGYICTRRFQCFETGEIGNFDHLGNALIQVLRVSTLDEWAGITYKIMKSFTNFAWIYFFLLAILGHFCMLKLILVALKVKYTETNIEELRKYSHSGSGRNSGLGSIEDRKFNMRKFQELGIYPKRITTPPEINIPLKDQSRRSSLSPGLSPRRNSKFYMRKLGNNLSDFSSFSKKRASRETIRNPKRTQIIDESSIKPANDFGLNNLKLKIQKKMAQNFGILGALFKFMLNLMIIKVERKNRKMFKEIRANFLRVVVKKDLEYSCVSEFDVLEISRGPKSDSKDMEELEIKYKGTKVKKKDYVDKFVRYFQENSPETWKEHLALVKNKNDLWSLDERYRVSGSKKKLRLPTVRRSLTHGIHERSVIPIIVNSQRSLKKKSIFISRISKNLWEQSLNVFGPKIDGIHKRANSRKVSPLLQQLPIIIEGPSKIQSPHNGNLGGRGSSSSSPSPFGSRNNLLSTYKSQNSLTSEKKRSTGSSLLFNCRNTLTLCNFDSVYFFERDYSTIKEKFEEEIVTEDKQDMADNKKRYIDIKKEDIQNKKIRKHNWSGNNVIGSLNFDQIREILMSLSHTRTKRYNWRTKKNYFFFNIRLICRDLVENKIVTYIFFLLVIANSLVLSLEGSIGDELWNDMNDVLNWIFFAEFLIKQMALGQKKYFRNVINLIDAIIVIYTVSIYILSTQIRNAKEEYNDLRFLQCIIVLRVMRVLQHFEFMGFIIVVMRLTLSFFIYIAILLFGIIIVYAFLGLNYYSQKLPERQINFDSFSTSVILVFQIITLDNWYILFEELINVYGDEKSFTIFYFISLIVIGNFLILQLFLANMLYGFEFAIISEIDNISDEVDDAFGSVKKYSLSSFYKQSFSIDIMKKLSSKKSENNSSVNNHEVSIQEFQDEESFQNDDKTHDTSLSFFLFSHNSFLRRLMKKTLKSFIFKKCDIAAVLLNITFLAIQTFYQNDQAGLDNMDRANLIVNLYFLFELIVKFIAEGVYWGPNATLKNRLNVLELFCIVSFLIGIIFKSEYPSLEILTRFNCLRTFRIIYLMKSTQAVFLSLIEALYQIFQVYLIVVTVWLMFGILGVFLYRNRFGYCDYSENYLISRARCQAQNLQWKVNEPNFENILQSLISLTFIGTMDNWVQLLAVSVNSSKDGPIIFNNQYSSYVYYITFLLIGRFFFIELFIGVVFANFTLSQKNSNSSSLTEDQIRWLKLQNLILDVEVVKFVIPSHGVRKKVFGWVNSKSFHSAIKVCLFLDVCAQAMHYECSGLILKELMKAFSSLMILIYVTEMILKFIGFGIKGYFSLIWHRLEFFIVLVGTLNIFVYYFAGTLEINGVSIIKGVTLFQVFVVFRLISKFKQTQNFLINFFFSLPVILNMICLLLITFFIFAIFGVYLFGTVKEGNVIDDYASFKNFYYSIFTLFRCSTAQDWIFIMIDVGKSPPSCTPGIDCGSQAAPFFFLFFMLITYYILLNMFLLIIFQQYEDFYKSNLTPSDFYNRVTDFQIAWANYSNNESLKEIKEEKIIPFLRYLGNPLGYSSSYNPYDIGKSLLRLKIPWYRSAINMLLLMNFYIYLSIVANRVNFYHMLYATIKKYYINNLLVKVKLESMRILKDHEKKFYKRIKRKIRRGRKFLITLSKIVAPTHPTMNTQENDPELKGRAFANPLSLYLSARLVFKTWKSVLNDKTIVEESCDDEESD